MAQFYHTRLNASDVERLTAALAKLDTIHDCVAGTNMSGKLAVLALCVEVYRTIEAVLQREVIKVQRASAAAGAESPQAPPAASSPGADASEAASVRPYKREGD